MAEELLRRLPASFGGYHEPFVGGGALFFRLYREGKIRRAIISDLNRELIDTYIAIRDRLPEVTELLSGYPHDKEFYYRLREKDPDKMTLPEKAARMIYLNKTGYNGLYRVNKKGKFNVPFGNYKNPAYYDPENLAAVSAALREATILCAPFETVIERARPDDLVYFDPPYQPVSQTAHFTAYQAGGFAAEDQERLRDVCEQLTRQGVWFILSNSDTPRIRELYAGFFIGQVQARRAINCKGEKRGAVSELIITNYRPPVSSAEGSP